MFATACGRHFMWNLSTRWSFGTREDHATRVGCGLRVVSTGAVERRRAALFAPPEACRNPSQEIHRTELAILPPCFVLRRGGDRWRLRCVDCRTFPFVWAANAAYQTRSNRGDRESHCQPRSNSATVW